MTTRPTCKIKWIDKKGDPTPDTNPAIGWCRSVDRYQIIHGRTLHFPASQWFPVCQEHARQMDSLDMSHWEFVIYEATNPDDFDNRGNFIRP